MKIGGQPVSFVMDSKDDAADPKTAMVVAQKLVDDQVPVQRYAPYSYDAAMALANAMQAAGSTDPNVYLPKLHELRTG